MSLEFRVQGSGFRVQGSGFRVQSSGFRAQSLLLTSRIPHLTSPISHLTSHISHLTSHISRSTFRVPHSKWLILTFVSAILLLGLIIRLTLAPGDDGTLADIQRRGTLRVGLDASFPPFEMLDAEGQIVGLDVDIATAIAADLGVEPKFVNIGFDGLYDALLARKVDIVISGLPYDPRWTEDVAYTRNYFNAGQILITLSGQPAIETVDDVAGHTLAVEWGSQADMEARGLAQELAGVTLLRRATAAEAIGALFSGEADAAIVDAVSGTAAFPRGLNIVDYLTDEWYAAAVHIESRDLLEAVNQSLLRLEKSGEMATMQARWLHGR